ncbi:MAG: hypothetical protein FJ087_15650 [Deltaproteobacteria bacterium]|nr:hypothetical protein [Deltaproteobacteria bacterium]
MNGGRVLTWVLSSCIGFAAAGALACKGGKACCHCMCSQPGKTVQATLTVEDCDQACRDHCSDEGVAYSASGWCSEVHSAPGETWIVDPGASGPDLPATGKGKVDFLLVVDDSPSMCQEQRALARLFGAFAGALGGLDLRVAVTSTNVCPKEKAEAVRGRFLYSPATSFPPDCVEKTSLPCASDAECRADASLPDVANWVCDTRPSVPIHVCDQAPVPIVLDAVSSSCRYKCTKDPNPCPAVSGDGTAECVFPGGDESRAGCIVPPATETCPADGPTVLDSTSIDAAVEDWKTGTWPGEPAWVGMADAEVRPLVAARLFACMATVGAKQSLCGNQEQGLLAAVIALDPAGENADQAKAFLRDEAALVVFVVSDENDCSAAEPVKAEKYAQCPCLADTTGCLPDGTCGQPPGPLLPVTDLADRLKSLKPDASRIVFAAVTGDVIPATATTPGPDAGQARKRYFECRCPAAPATSSAIVYACSSPAGRADFGSRHVAMAEAFGENGIVENLCEPAGLDTALARTAAAARKIAGL